MKLLKMAPLFALLILLAAATTATASAATSNNTTSNMLAAVDWPHYNGDKAMSGAADLITANYDNRSFKYFNLSDGYFMTYRDANKHTPLFIENTINPIVFRSDFEHFNTGFYPSAGVGNLKGVIYLSDGTKHNFTLKEQSFLGLTLTNTISIDNESYSWTDYLPNYGYWIPFVGSKPGNVYIDLVRGTTSTNYNQVYLSLATDPLMGSLKEEWDMVASYTLRWIPMLGQKWELGQANVQDYRDFQVGGVLIPVAGNARIIGYDITQQSTINTVHGYVFYPVTQEELSSGMSLVGVQENLFTMFSKLMTDFGSALSTMIFLFDIFAWFFVDPSHWLLLLVFYECFALVMAVRNCGNFFTMVKRLVRSQVVLFTFMIQALSMLMSVVFFVMQALEPMINIITSIFGSVLNLLVGGVGGIFGTVGNAMATGVESTSLGSASAVTSGRVGALLSRARMSAIWGRDAVSK